jgi:hypothetical protein
MLTRLGGSLPASRNARQVFGREIRHLVEQVRVDLDGIGGDDLSELGSELGSDLAITHAIRR